MAYELNGAQIEHDEEGYLTDLSQWNNELAVILAKDENIEMNDEHWEVVNLSNCPMQKANSALLSAAE